MLLNGCSHSEYVFESNVHCYYSMKYWRSWWCVKLAPYLNNDNCCTRQGSWHSPAKVKDSNTISRISDIVPSKLLSNSEAEVEHQEEGQRNNKLKLHDDHFSEKYKKGVKRSVKENICIDRVPYVFWVGVLRYVMIAQCLLYIHAIVPWLTTCKWQIKL